MRIVFMGTPEFAVPTLEQLLAAGHEIVLVVTQPDRPAGRGRRLAAPPVKEAALRHGLPVLQPRRVREQATLHALTTAAPQVVVVAAFGQILPRQILELPPLGCLNVHASLLPRWRGAAPISAAILAGDEVTGVTVMLMDEGLDTGPLLAQATEPIRPSDTTQSLGRRLAEMGARLLTQTLPAWQRGEVQATPQDHALASYAPMLKKEDGLLDWRRPAVELWRRCRACVPWPGAFTWWRGRLLKVIESAPLRDGEPGAGPGEVAVAAAAEARARAPYPELLPEGGRVLTVGTGEGVLALLRVQLEGGRPLAGEEFARGHREVIGARFGA